MEPLEPMEAPVHYSDDQGPRELSENYVDEDAVISSLAKAHGEVWKHLETVVVSGHTGTGLREAGMALGQYINQPSTAPEALDIWNHFFINAESDDAAVGLIFVANELVCSHLQETPVYQPQLQLEFTHTLISILAERAAELKSRGFYHANFQFKKRIMAWRIQNALEEPILYQLDRIAGGIYVDEALEELALISTQERATDFQMAEIHSELRAMLNVKKLTRDAATIVTGTNKDRPYQDYHWFSLALKAMPTLWTKLTNRICVDTEGNPLHEESKFKHLVDQSTYEKLVESTIFGPLDGTYPEVASLGPDERDQLDNLVDSESEIEEGGDNDKDRDGHQKEIEIITQRNSEGSGGLVIRESVKEGEYDWLEALRSDRSVIRSLRRGNEQFESTLVELTHRYQHYLQHAQDQNVVSSMINSLDDARDTITSILEEMKRTLRCRSDELSNRAAIILAVAEMMKR